MLERYTQLRIQITLEMDGLRKELQRLTHLLQEREKQMLRLEGAIGAFEAIKKEKEQEDAGKINESTKSSNDNSDNTVSTPDSNTD